MHTGRRSALATLPCTGRTVHAQAQGRPRHTAQPRREHACTSMESAVPVACCIMLRATYVVLRMLRLACCINVAICVVSCASHAPALLWPQQSRPRSALAATNASCANRPIDRPRRRPHADASRRRPHADELRHRRVLRRQCSAAHPPPRAHESRHPAHSGRRARTQTMYSRGYHAVRETV
jgi:hypothetical protein